MVSLHSFCTSTITLSVNIIRLTCSLVLDPGVQALETLVHSLHLHDYQDSWLTKVVIYKQQNLYIHSALPQHFPLFVNLIETILCPYFRNLGIGMPASYPSSTLLTDLAEKRMFIRAVFLYIFFMFNLLSTRSQVYHWATSKWNIRIVSLQSSFIPFIPSSL